MSVFAKTMESLGFGGREAGEVAPPAAAPRSNVSRLSSVTSPRAFRRGAETGQIRTFLPHSFNDAGDIAYYYRMGISVIVNMNEVDAATRRRLVDFLTGLKEGLEGQVTRVTETVYLVVPNNVVVDDGEDHAAFSEDGVERDPLIIPINQ